MVQYQLAGWWSKGDSNREPLSDAFVNFAPFEGRGDANGDRPERAGSCPSLATPVGQDSALRDVLLAPRSMALSE